MTKSPRTRPVLVYTSKEGIPGRETFGSMYTDAAIGLSSAPQKSKRYAQLLPVDFILPEYTRWHRVHFKV